MSQTCSTVFALGVGPAVPDSVRTVRDFMAFAKANPDKATYGSPAAGSTPHFVGALIERASGTEIRHELAVDETGLPCQVVQRAGDFQNSTVYEFNTDFTIEAPLEGTPVSGTPEG